VFLALLGGPAARAGGTGLTIGAIRVTFSLHKSCSPVYFALQSTFAREVADLKRLPKDPK
jgi:hypothetical protein